MSRSPSDRLGPYGILAPIGMGEVYRTEVVWTSDLKT